MENLLCGVYYCIIVVSVWFIVTGSVILTLHKICVYFHSVDIVTEHQTMIFAFYICQTTYVSEPSIIELQMRQSLKKTSQIVEANGFMEISAYTTHFNGTVVPCMNSEALLLISEENNLVYGKIYCLLPLLLKLEGLHSGIKQYFIIHSFCRILQLSER